MASTTPPQPLGPSRRRSLALLTAALMGLALAFTTVPAVVAGALHGSRDVDSLKTALSDDLVAYTGAGRSSFGADLTGLVGYWRAWHATKIVICALALVVVVLLARDLWRRYERGPASAWASARWAATGATILVPMVAVALAANVQATAVPSVALLQLLPPGAGGALGTALADVQRQVRTVPDAAGWSPPVQHLAHDVRAYHLILAVVAGVMVLAAASIAARTWRQRRGASSQRRRTMLTTTGVVAAVSAVALTILLVSEVQGVLDPGAALVDVIGRG